MCGAGHYLRCEDICISNLSHITYYGILCAFGVNLIVCDNVGIAQIYTVIQTPVYAETYPLQIKLIKKLFFTLISNKILEVFFAVYKIKG